MLGRRMIVRVFRQYGFNEDVATNFTEFSILKHSPSINCHCLTWVLAVVGDVNRQL